MVGRRFPFCSTGAFLGVPPKFFIGSYLCQNYYVISPFATFVSTHDVPTLSRHESECIDGRRFFKKARGYVSLEKFKLSNKKAKSTKFFKPLQT